MNPPTALGDRFYAGPYPPDEILASLVTVTGVERLGQLLYHDPTAHQGSVSSIREALERGGVPCPCVNLADNPLVAYGSVHYDRLLQTVAAPPPPVSRPRNRKRMFVEK